MMKEEGGGRLRRDDVASNEGMKTIKRENVNTALCALLLPSSFYL